MANDKQHLNFGGSSAHRWLACPGSARLCATLPPQPENEHMAAGTRAHALFELAMREAIDDVLGYDGTRLNAGWPVFDLSDVIAVQVAVDHARSVIDRHPDTIFWVERQFTLGEDIGGTADLVIYTPSTRTLDVIDYKHGVGKYVPESTPQMKLYAACVLFGMGEYEIERINATIIQPRCLVGEPVRTAVYSPGDLIGFSDDVDDAVALARSDDPPFCPGETQCHWCPAQMAAACPALFKGAVAVPKKAVAGVNSRDLDPVFVTLPAPEAMAHNLAALADTLKVLPILQKWIDGVEAAAENAMNGGHHLPGFKLVEKIARRKWASEEDALKWFAEQTMLDEDEYAPRKLLTVAQAEKVVKQSAGKDGVKAMADHVVKESSGLKVVPEDAKGEAVNPLQLSDKKFGPIVDL